MLFSDAMAAGVADLQHELVAAAVTFRRARLTGYGPHVPVEEVAVGTRISPRPPHRSRRALLTHRAPTLDGDEEPPLWPRMQDAWERQVPVSDRLHSRPRKSTSLASTHQGAMPTFDHVMAEC